MSELTSGRSLLYELVEQWDDDPSRTTPSYRKFLDDVFFHAELRYREYRPFPEEGPFGQRLWNWLKNVHSDHDRKVLLTLLRRLVYIDTYQTRALYRDAYRRIVAPWLISANSTISELVRPRFHLLLRERLARASIACITESFDFPSFVKVNSLAGLEKAVTLTEDPKVAEAVITAHARFSKCSECIIFEDFVGTGKQSRNVVATVRRLIPCESRVLFVPLIILERGLSTLQELVKAGVDIGPALVIKTITCLQRDAVPKEDEDMPLIRSLVVGTASRVLAKFGIHDDPPGNPFGYRGSGAFVVTSHNVPNNTLPLFHHRAPSWNPLFRRVHHRAHSKDGL